MGRFQFDDTNGFLFYYMHPITPIVTLTIKNSGKVGIGTQNPDELLSVKGKIHAEEVKVDLAVPADYVFQKYYKGFSKLNPDYEMLPLEEVEPFLKANHHLPGLPLQLKFRKTALNWER
ncbi:MAG TPA: hypothetical protein VKY36_07315 [Moheibacter sp.]|nr:hypothetical protein [Moheibacter sp.]